MCDSATVVSVYTSSTHLQLATVPRFSFIFHHQHYHFEEFFDACDRMRVWLDIDDSELNESCVGQDSDVLPFVGLYIDTRERYFMRIR
jgi:hypothetical protein